MHIIRILETIEESNFDTIVRTVKTRQKKGLKFRF